MGYYSTLVGELTLEPPVFDESLVTRILEETETDFWLTLEGDKLVRTEESGKAYHLERELQTLLTQLRAQGIDARGILYRIGEESPDIEHFVLQDGKVTAEVGKVTFSDGSIWTRY